MKKIYILCALLLPMALLFSGCSGKSENSEPGAAPGRQEPTPTEQEQVEGEVSEKEGNEKWIVFEYREGTGNQVCFGDEIIDADELSEETLEWLDWYNSLTKKEQLAVSSLPPELLAKSGLAEAEDAPASAAE